jgi:hypothetical protein
MACGIPTTHWHLSPSTALAPGVHRGTIQGKEGGIQVLAGLAPSSQTVGSNERVIHASEAQLMNDRSECSSVPLAAKLGEGERQQAG